MFGASNGDKFLNLYSAQLLQHELEGDVDGVGVGVGVLVGVGVVPAQGFSLIHAVQSA